MKTDKSRFEELRSQFLAYHRANPETYTMFRHFTLQMITSGAKHGAAKMIVERIRWETSVVMRRGNDFKINNNHAPFYARLFMHHYPEHDGFFRVRHMTSKDSPETGLPPLMPSDYPEEGK